MAYIGAQPRLGNFQACDAITTSATTTFNLLVGGTAIFPQSAQHCLVSLNGVLQAPISSYTISGSTIIFAAALTTDDSIDFITILGDTLDLGVPSDDTVGAAQIKADLISGTTALAAEPADTDEFLVSDAGVLKRIDYSLIKGGSLTMADQWRLTSDASFDDTVTDLTANLEQVDRNTQGTIGSAMTVSSGIFTFPSTGVYLVTAILAASRGGNSRYVEVHINATANNSTYARAAQGMDSINQTDSGDTKCNPIAQSLIDVTNTTNVKVKFSCVAFAACTAVGDTNENRTSFTFIRLGDT